MAGHGAVLAERLANSMAGLPAPMVLGRLVLVLGSALDELPVERAVELVAWSICDVECRSCDYCDPETCMDECTAVRAEELRKLLEEGRARGMRRMGRG
ncbi:hypothetical protein [Pyrodictium abyssi]|uniref:4Fe-4S ferredoxin-type domain-containing protein n=1 Tax=Pyrodictium abyssi TaxID=54256 RepID=A0ABN6ZQR1_9CREN|nr:hypothetical protein PABY_21540 [Pyrodictium abyssi]